MEETDEQNETDKNAVPDAHYQVYLDERKTLIEAIKDTAQQFDKAILTLSAGALAISITFIEKIAPRPLPDTLWLLYTSWIVFVLSMLSTLTSFIASQKACYTQIKILEYEYFQKGKDQSNPYRTWTDRLNIASIISFVISVVLLVAFSIANLKSRETTQMPNEKATSNSKTTNPNTGYSPPSTPLTPSKVPPAKK